MGKKKKKKKKQVAKAATETVVENNGTPVEPAENPKEENPEECQPSAVDDSSGMEKISVSSDEVPATQKVPGETPEPEVPEKKEAGKKQPEQLKISTVEEKINADIRTRSRLRRMLPDIIRVTLALTVIGVGAAIWWKPPLLTASFPITTYKYKRGPVKEALLYRPLAMQERYYVKLPEKLENRYEWFAIDRRRRLWLLRKNPNIRSSAKRLLNALINLVLTWSSARSTDMNGGSISTLMQLYFRTIFSV